jgi:tRNA dimethylallyltransferase
MPLKILIVAGPTATGKTSIAVELAQRFDAEVVSADSMQVFRGLDIGTAKPTPEELRGVPHHLIDVVNPDEPFDAASFVRLADAAIEDIAKRGKRAIVAGGSGLYLRTLLHGLQRGPKPAPEIRDEILECADKAGWPSLHEELMRRDPDTAARLHPNDGVRILRALEVATASGVPLSEWQKQHQFKEERYDHLYLGLNRPRDELTARINSRVDHMMAGGFLEEVKGLIEKGYGPDLKPMQGLGYRRLCQHLEGALSLDEAVEKTKTDTRRFAKRQVTWFKKEQGLRWVSPDLSEIEPLAASFWQSRP